MTKKSEITVIKAYQDGRVGIRVALKSWGHGASINMQGSTDLSSAEARELAAALIRGADETDGRVAKKAETEERRRKWRDREIASGRMVEMSAAEFFRR